MISHPGTFLLIAIVVFGNCNSSPHGMFRVVRYAFASITATDEETAKAMLGKTATIDEKSITFDGRNCQPERFTERKVDTGLYLDRYHASKADLMISAKTITVVDTKCQGLFSEFAILSNNEIMVADEGAFYFLSRE